MNTASRTAPEARGSMPNRLALVAGLRRMRRAQIPRALAAGEVVVRLNSGGQARMVHGGGARG